MTALESGRGREITPVIYQEQFPIKTWVTRSETALQHPNFKFSFLSHGCSEKVYFVSLKTK